MFSYGILYSIIIGIGIGCFLIGGTVVFFIMRKFYVKKSLNKPVNDQKTKNKNSTDDTTVYYEVENNKAEITLKTVDDNELQTYEKLSNKNESTYEHLNTESF